jgi:hypothetical protein
VHGVSDVRQTEMYIAEPNSFKVASVIEKLVRYTLLGTDKIPAELIQPGDNTLCSESPDLLILL